MAKAKQPVAEFFLPGDKVLWRGIKLTVEQVFEDGSVEAVSQTMRVKVSDVKQLERYVAS